MWDRLEDLPQYVCQPILPYSLQILGRIDDYGDGLTMDGDGDGDGVGGNLVDWGFLSEVAVQFRSQSRHRPQADKRVQSF